MDQQNIFKGNNEEEVWNQINEQFIQNPDPLEYLAVIEQGDRKVILDVDIDLGGGFESGYETTTFTAPLHHEPLFRFAIHEEHFTDEIGKFFGMQDVKIGYEEFDKELIIKTNDEARVKQIFADASVRAVFQNLKNFTFGITHHRPEQTDQREPYLELNIETGITDVNELRKLYKAFFSVLQLIDPSTTIETTVTN
jgi:hypothetical protein